MTTPRVYKTEAIVIKQTSLGEADKVLTLYTPNLGKIRALAKGVRKPKSKLAGHVEPLTRSTLMLARGQNLDIVTQGQTTESFLPLRHDLWRASCAIYVADILDAFTVEKVEGYPIYKLLVETLRHLDEVSNIAIALRYFELHLLGCLGYRPQLRECLGCRSPLEPTTNFFSASGGGVLCPHCSGTEPVAQPISVTALKVLRLLQNSDWSVTGRLRLTPDLSWELERLLRGYIRYLLEREVKSVAFLDRLRRENKGVPAPFGA